MRIGSRRSGATMNAVERSRVPGDIVDPSRFSRISAPFAASRDQAVTEASRVRSVRELQSYAIMFKASQSQRKPMIKTDPPIEVLDFADDFAVYRGFDPEDETVLRRYVEELHILNNALRERIRKGEE